MRPVSSILVIRSEWAGSCAPRRDAIPSDPQTHLLLCGAMDYLWTPWRYAYVSAGEQDLRDASFAICLSWGTSQGSHRHRGQHCYVMLNTYPYTSGHVMIVPFAHLDELQKLPHEAAHEMMDLAQTMEARFATTLSPGWDQSGNEYRQSRRSRRGWTHPYARACRAGWRCQFHVGGGRNEGVPGESGNYVSEDKDSTRPEYETSP